MKLTLYRRTYPVAGAPVTLSVVPFATSQRHTFPTGGKVYEATYSEIHVIAPDDAKVESLKNRVTWDGEKGKVSSTASEVFDLATAGASGFRLAK